MIISFAQNILSFRLPRWLTEEHILNIIYAESMVLNTAGIKKKSFTQNFEIFSKRAHITNVANTWLPLITAKSVKQYQCNGPSGKRQSAELYYSGKDIQRQEEIIG